MYLINGVILWNEFSSKVCFDVSFAFSKRALKTFIFTQVYFFCYRLDSIFILFHLRNVVYVFIFYTLYF